MKKYQHLGRQLSREEQMAINGGFTQYANSMCTCDDGYGPFPVCDSNCSGVYVQCNTYCGGSSHVISYGTCTFEVACW